jgi:hypothetical protein
MTPSTQAQAQAPAQAGAGAELSPDSLWQAAGPKRRAGLQEQGKRQGTQQISNPLPHR